MKRERLERSGIGSNGGAREQTSHDECDSLHKGHNAEGSEVVERRGTRVRTED